MPAPDQQLRCPHYYSGGPPHCQSCSASAQAVQGPTSYQPNEQARFNRYHLDPKAQVQSRRDQQAVLGQRHLTSEQTYVNGNVFTNSAGGNSGPSQLPATYPYPTDLPELGNVRTNTATLAGGSGYFTRQPPPNRQQASQSRPSAISARRVSASSSRPTQPVRSQQQTSSTQQNPPYRRPLLASTTGTSFHNARTSTDGVYGDESDDDDDEGDESDEEDNGN